LKKKICAIYQICGLFPVRECFLSDFNFSFVHGRFARIARTNADFLKIFP
jgi:hypothetical protein